MGETAALRQAMIPRVSQLIFKRKSAVQILSVAIILALAPAGLPVSADKVRMVVTAAFVSEAGLPIYTELADYISRKTSQSVKTISGISYTEASQMLQPGIILVGFICGLPKV